MPCTCPSDVVSIDSGDVEYGVVHLACRVLERRGDVGILEIAIVCEDFGTTRPIRKHLEYLRHTNAHAANAGSPATLIGIEGDAVLYVHDPPGRIDYRSNCSPFESNRAPSWRLTAMELFLHVIPQGGRMVCDQYSEQITFGRIGDGNTDRPLHHASLSSAITAERSRCLPN